MEYAQMNKAPSSPQEMPTSTEERMRNMRATMEQYMTTASDRAHGKRRPMPTGPCTRTHGRP